jgi:hypothetical protein
MRFDRIHDPVLRRIERSPPGAGERLDAADAASPCIDTRDLTGLGAAWRTRRTARRTATS